MNLIQEFHYLMSSLYVGLHHKDHWQILYQRLNKQYENFESLSEQQKISAVEYINDSILEIQLTGKAKLNLTGLTRLTDCGCDLIFRKCPNTSQLIFFGCCLQEISNSIERLTNLQFLDISYGQLTHLPDTFTKLSNLSTLHANANQLTSLPKQWRQLTNLKFLNLNNNFLQSLPKDFCDSGQLIEVSLVNNQLTTLTGNWQHCLKLCSLNISYNFLTELPTALSSLPMLALLQASGNNIPFAQKSYFQQAYLKHSNQRWLGVAPPHGTKHLGCKL